MPGSELPDRRAPITGSTGPAAAPGVPRTVWRSAPVRYGIAVLAIAAVALIQRLILPEQDIAPFVKAGRALFVVDLPGYPGRERPPGYQRPAGPTVAFRQRAVSESIDVRRGLDYLETRKDVDAGRVAFMNASISWQGILFSAVETRYRGVVLVADGLYPSQAEWVAEANPVNFAPHIRASTCSSLPSLAEILISGRPFRSDSVLARTSEASSVATSLVM